MSCLLGAYRPSWSTQALVADTMFFSRRVSWVQIYLTLTSWDNITPFGEDSGQFLMGLSLEKQMVAIVLGDGGSSSTGFAAPYFSISENLTILRPSEVASSTILGLTSLMVTMTLRQGGAELRMLVRLSSSLAMTSLAPSDSYVLRSDGQFLASFRTEI